MIKPMDWDALRRVFGTPAPSAECEGTVEDRSEDLTGFALALDLADERAGIMEYDGGLTRKEAEDLSGYTLLIAKGSL